MSLTAMVLLLRQPQKGLSVSMVNTLGDHLLERMAHAPGRDPAARLATLERENVAMQLCLASLMRLLEERGQLTRADVEKLADLVQRLATATPRPAAPAPAPRPGVPAAKPAEPVPEEEAIADAAAALAQAAQAAPAVVEAAPGAVAPAEAAVESSQDLAALAQALQRAGMRPRT